MMWRAFSVGGYMRLIKLNDEFYRTYGSCSEILQKKARPYACLEVCIDGVTFAIPFRHHIKHKHAFITYGECGLDYTKAVVLTSGKFVSSDSVQIDQIEFNAIKGKERRIHKGMSDYLLLYKKAIQYRANRHYENIRRCSSLQYFHAELHIK